MANGKPYSGTEDQYMRDNAGKVQAKQMAADLGRPLTSIWNRARYLGLDLKTKRTHELWTADEDGLLIALTLDGMQTKEAAEKLERPWASVAMRKTKLRKEGRLKQTAA